MTVEQLLMKITRAELKFYKEWLAIVNDLKEHANQERNATQYQFYVGRSTTLECIVLELEETLSQVKKLRK